MWSRCQVKTLILINFLVTRFQLQTNGNSKKRAKTHRLRRRDSWRTGPRRTSERRRLGTRGAALASYRRRTAPVPGQKQERMTTRDHATPAAGITVRRDHTSHVCSHLNDDPLTTYD